MALYPYTLQPIALNLTEAEFQQAQYELFTNASPSFGLKSLKNEKVDHHRDSRPPSHRWTGLFLTGYSTIIFG